MGGTDRARYSEEAQISAGSATNDFRRLVDAGLVMQSTAARRPATKLPTPFAPGATGD
jgi:hypothetical protein